MAGERRSELVLAGTPVLLAIFTLLVLFDPSVAPALVNAPLDLVLNAAAILVAVAAAIIGWSRFRAGGDRAALVRGAAFLVLAAQNLALVTITVAGASAELGLELATAGQLPLWSAVTGRGLAAVLFVAAGLLGGDGSTMAVPRARLVLLGPAAAVLAGSLLLVAASDALPTLLDPGALARLRQDPTALLLDAGGPLLIGVQAGIGLAFLAAAGLSYRSYRRRPSGAEMYLVIGFTIAAFSQVHSALHPGSYASLVTTGDLLRVAFYAVLLLVVAAEAGADVRAVRLANRELQAMRETDVTRATLEERARLAREIHDGMSQELWYAKLKQSRLAALDGLPAEGRQLAEEVATAIESALSEARQAILALRPSEGGSFAEVLDRYVEDFADRFGIPAECRCDAIADHLPARSQAELLRIVQEALTNVRRHADATRVRVELTETDGGLRLLVADNGRGFVVEAADRSRYGLGSIRERAALIGAELRVESAPSDGTRVIVELARVGN